MTVTIAVAGKGGTGKTTFSSLVVKYLVEMGRTPVLAIDADPSSNLNSALGLELYDTVGQIREDTAVQVSTGSFQTGISKPDWFEYKINECLVEGDGMDLLAMGRPEGAGCYCAANNILRNCIDTLGDEYPYIVIDNEAGMEHISRQTTRDISLLFAISDPTYRGLSAVRRIAELTEELGTRIQRAFLIVNNVRGELPDVFVEQIASVGLPLLGTLPNDPMVTEFDLLGRPFFELDDASPVYTQAKLLISSALEQIVV